MEPQKTPFSDYLNRIHLAIERLDIKTTAFQTGYSEQSKGEGVKKNECTFAKEFLALVENAESLEKRLNI